MKSTKADLMWLGFRQKNKLNCRVMHYRLVFSHITITQ